MGEIQCFFVVESARATQALRRYRLSTIEKCDVSGHGYHNASVRIEDVATTPKAYLSAAPASAFAGDPRWPTHCACGYEFRAEDEWQVFTESIYVDAATGREWPMRELPPGAMYDAWWYRGSEGSEDKSGPDGLNLCLCLPPKGGLDYWHIDGPANNGPGWSRSGTVPNITAQPSILTPRYHGWLRDGVLVEC
jgi:hypothetical protein